MNAVSNAQRRISTEFTLTQAYPYTSLPLHKDVHGHNDHSPINNSFIVLWNPNLLCENQGIIFFDNVITFQIPNKAIVT